MKFTRLILAATFAAAPVVLAVGAANATPATTSPVVASSATIRLTDYDDWYYWHCRVQHEWWRPRCHPEWAPQPPQPMPPTGSF